MRYQDIFGLFEYLYKADDFSPTLDYLYQALMAYNDEWSYRIIKDSFNYQKRSMNEMDLYDYKESLVSTKND